MSNENNVVEGYYFPTTIYTVDAAQYLPAVREVAMESIAKAKEHKKGINHIYPANMSMNFHADPRAKEFSDFLKKMSWDILNAQGYQMDLFKAAFGEMWLQEHFKHSSMEQHVHGLGAQIVGFYFLETPKFCSKLVLHDPRPGKVQLNLPERDMREITYGSNQIVLDPEPGMLVFTNAWLPHSFSRHGANDPIRFVHFNLYTQRDRQQKVCQHNHAPEIV
jgi:hypothetical protein